MKGVWTPGRWRRITEPDGVHRVQRLWSREQDMWGCATHRVQEPDCPRCPPPAIAATAFYQGERVFLRIGNYEFEVVCPPILVENMSGDAAARATAELLEEQLQTLAERA